MQRQILRTFRLDGTADNGGGPDGPIYLDEVGTIFAAAFTIGAGDDCRPHVARFSLAGAVVTFFFGAPDGTVVAKSTTLAHGRAQYELEADFIDQAGGWTWQPKVVTADGTWFGSLETFSVVGHLDAT